MEGRELGETALDFIRGISQVHNESGGLVLCGSSNNVAPWWLMITCPAVAWFPRAGH